MPSSLLRSAILAVVVLIVAAPALPAGDYHDLGTLECADCHVMHVGIPPETASAVAEVDDDLGTPMGLLRDGINDLCLSCHDNSPRAADVLGRNAGSRPHDVRQGGSLNRLGTTGLPSTGHTLDSLDVSPGSSPPWTPEDENGAGEGLHCVNCHAPHGRQDSEPAYRNLRSDAGNNRPGEGLVTYNHGAPGLNDPTRDVFVRRSLAYDESEVDFNEPDENDSGMGRFCAGCHGLFHGAPGDANIGGSKGQGGYGSFVRHPSAGVNFGAAGRRRSGMALETTRQNRVKGMSKVGTWNSPGADVTPTCITCHKGHGNDNPFGLINRSGTGKLTENGDSDGGRLPHLCQQCHPQGRTDPFL